MQSALGVILLSVALVVALLALLGWFVARQMLRELATFDDLEE